MPKLSVIIPCYNEGKRLSVESFCECLKNSPDIELLFVDDGSKDNTLELLEQIKSNYPANTRILTFQKNKGKSETVRQGFLYALQRDESEYIGYLDADLSTGFGEFLRIFEIAVTKKADFVIGSRIKMLNHKIDRSFIRHIIGRILATIIDAKFKLRIYDTQCGAKIFTSGIAKDFCNMPFKTKWFFDIEIFIRLRKKRVLTNGLEIPLQKWSDISGSKISLLSFPVVLKDIFRLMRHYKSK